MFWREIIYWNISKNNSENILSHMNTILRGEVVTNIQVLPKDSE